MSDDFHIPSAAELRHESREMIGRLQAENTALRAALVEAQKLACAHCSDTNVPVLVDGQWVHQCSVYMPSIKKTLVETADCEGSDAANELLHGKEGG